MRHLLSSVSCFLLSLMTAEEQCGLINKMPSKTFSCFMDWPRQDLFLDNLDVMWTRILESEYEIFTDILNDGFLKPGFYFPDLFQDFFQRSPVAFKECFVDHEIKSCGFFSTFMRNEDSESIRIVLRNLDHSDKVRLVFSQRGLGLIYQYRDSWPVMEVFIREANLTRDEKQRLKEAVTKYGMRFFQVQGINEEFRRFFVFLDEGEASGQTKRSTEDNASTEVKKLCVEGKKTTQ